MISALAPGKLREFGGGGSALPSLAGLGYAFRKGVGEMNDLRTFWGQPFEPLAAHPVPETPDAPPGAPTGMPLADDRYEGGDPLPWEAAGLLFPAALGVRGMHDHFFDELFVEEDARPPQRPLTPDQVAALWFEQMPPKLGLDFAAAEQFVVNRLGDGHERFAQLPLRKLRALARVNLMAVQQELRGQPWFSGLAGEQRDRLCNEANRQLGLALGLSGFRAEGLDARGTLTEEGLSRLMRLAEPIVPVDVEALRQQKGRLKALVASIDPGLMPAVQVAAQLLDGEHGHGYVPAPQRRAAAEAIVARTQDALLSQEWFQGLLPEYKQWYLERLGTRVLMSLDDPAFVKAHLEGGAVSDAGVLAVVEELQSWSAAQLQDEAAGSGANSSRRKGTGRFELRERIRGGFERILARFRR